MRSLVQLLFALLLTCLAAPAGGAPDVGESFRRGQYLVTIMECAGCHTTGALIGQRRPGRFLTGSEVGFGGSVLEGSSNGGAVYPPNLTPDPETGLGAWTDDQIIRAIRLGRRPDGRALSLVMPWVSYSMLTDSDVRDIVAYLRGIPAVKYKVPENFGPGETPTGPYLQVEDVQRPTRGDNPAGMDLK